MNDIVANMTFNQLWEYDLRSDPEQAFLVYQDRDGKVARYSYADFEIKVSQVANLLLSYGVAVGSRVVVQLCNSPEFIACQLALTRLGAVMVPMSDQSTYDEACYILDQTQAELVITEPQFLHLHQRLNRERGPQSGFKVLLARTDADEDDAPSLNRLMITQATTCPEAVGLDADTVCEIIFTSGTTAKPKGVLITQGNLVFSGYYGVWQTSLRKDDRMFTTMPACHSNFQLAALTPVVAAGATLILLEKYSAHRFWSQVRQTKATVIQCISMIVRTLLAQPATRQDRKHEVREVLYFLPLSTADKDAFEQRFGVRLMNSFGSTESVCWSITDPPCGERRWPSVGRAGLGYAACIRDDDGRELPPGEIGEICIQGVPGRSLMLGYLDDPSRPQINLGVITEGNWLHTGDKGYVDADGWFYFVDRKSNMIKRAGENISAAEIETVLMDHPDILEAGVVGVPDPIRDQAVKAFVVLRRGSKLGVQDIIDYCAEHLSAYKVPTLVELRRSLPHTCSMKVDKHALQNQ